MKTSSCAALLLILLLAAVNRVWLIQTDKVAFSSDEAVVGLMARHITEGKPIPTFYYGQHYMGSLDAVLVAIGFEVLGESVRSIRYVQLVLFLLVVWTGCLLAYEVSRRRSVALVTALLLAVPSMLGTTYTTLTLGGYNEILLLGNLALLLGWQVTVGNSETPWRWFALGFFLGVGWWVNGTIITPLVIVSLMGLRCFSSSKWRLYGLGGAGFFIGGGLWWLYNFRHDWQALEFLFSDQLPPDTEPLSLPAKLIAFLFIGLPGLYGFRFPWESAYYMSLLSLLAALVYLLLVSHRVTNVYAHLRYGKINKTAPSDSQVITPVMWVWLSFLVLGVIFMLSTFQDATGRYLLPIWIPAMIGVAMSLMQLRHWAFRAGLLALLVTFHLGTTFTTAKSEVGIEPQLASGLQVDARYDAELLAFLEEEGYEYGYASYWVSYRLMFRTGEQVIFDTSLPYDEKGYRAHNNRYPPYVERVRQAARVVWITQNFPALDDRIAALLAENHVTYQTRDFGPYRVYYDFSERVAPADFNLNSQKPLDET